VKPIKNPVFILLLLMMLLSSCQLKQTPVEDTKNYTLATLHIAYYHIKGSDGHHDASLLSQAVGLHPIESRIIKFREKYPNVKIYYTSMSGINRVQKKFESDSVLPDIIEINPNHAKYLIRDRLVNQDVYYDDEMRMWEKYNRIIDATRIDGEMLLMPVRSEPLIVLYNRTIFENLGVTPPSEDWTWDEFENIASQLQQRGYTPIIQQNFNAIEPIIRAFGGNYVGKPGEVNGYLNSPATIAAFEKLFKLPLKFEPYIRKVENSMYISIPSSLGISLEDDIKDYTAIPLPRASDGSAYNTMFTTGLAISKSSEHADLAWELIRTIIGDSDEEAIEFLAYNTLYSYSIKRPSASEDIYEQLYKGHLSSEPSTFYTNLYPYSWRSDADFVIGQDALKELLDGADVAATLGKYAQIIEEGIPQIFMK